MNAWLRCLFPVLPVFLCALPQNGQIVQGLGQIEYADSEVSIRSDENIWIDWQNFSLDANEQVIFSQKDASSIALNRVLTSEPSALFGRIQSNGQVVLINPNGLIVGKEARIDTASFIASALPLNTDVYKSSHKIAFLEHRGSKIEWEGKIRCPKGEIVLAAEEIAILGKAQIDVSCPSGGGRIFIGSKEDFPKAQRIWLGPQATLSANAEHAGNGGEVILWSHEHTAVYGLISATGGSLNGDGGFIDVSSPKHLNMAGLADTRAPYGKTGKLLLDPSQIDIGTYGMPAPPLTSVYDPPGPTATVDATQLGTLLGMTDVFITTAGGSGGNGQITVSSPVTWAMPTKLTLSATNELIINADIKPTAGGTLEFNSANGNVRIQATPSQSAVVEITGGPITGTSIAVNAPNGVLYMSSQPGFKSQLHSLDSTSSGDFIIETKGVQMVVNSTPGSPSNIEIQTFRGDLHFILDGDFYIQASSGNSMTLLGSANVVAGKDFANTFYGGSIFVQARNLIIDARQSLLGNGNGSFQSAQVLPISTGDINMTLTGSAYLFGGPGENSNASIFAAGGGALNFSVNGDLTLISTAVNPVNSLSVAFIGTNFFSSGGGPLNVQVGGDLFMQGGSPSANPGVFTLAALVGGSDTRIIVNGSATLRSGSPGVSANCGAVIRGFSGPVYFSANSLTMSGTALGGNASILSAANTTAISQGNISTNLGTISGLADTYIESVSGAINAIDSTFAGTNGFLTMLAPQSIFFDPTTLTATTGIFVKAGVDISFINNSSATTTAGPITLVVDDQFPAPPQIGPGRFVIDSTSFINANQFPISIYTARQQLNSISPFATFNGAFFVAGTLYIDSLEEIWCTYFPTQLLPAVPFKISYKDCLSAALQSATLIVDEFLEGMHPADEYLGWCERFTIERLGEDEKRTYSISRRKLQFINHPKTWTALIHFIPKSE